MLGTSRAASSRGIEMASRIIDIAEARRSRSAAKAVDSYAAPVSERFHFWTGASGERYVHSVYNLVDCPAIPSANYVLVRRDASGVCYAMDIGRVDERAPSLNLARIRQLGARLGATEVHIHLLASNGRQGKLIEFDLKSALAGDSCSAGARVCH